MDIAILLLIIVMLALQGWTYWSLAYVFSWLRARVIPPTAFRVEEVDDESEQEDDEPDSFSRGLYL